MRRKLDKIVAIILASTMLASCGATADKNKTNETSADISANADGSIVLDPDNPTNVTVWNYYNGDQLAAFDKLVSEFNSTIGVEKGIVVKSVSQGSIENLSDSLLDSADGKAGAQDLPTLAAVYADSAYILDQKKILDAYDDYFTQEEWDEYVPGFIEEGKFVEEGKMMLFPVSKSTECFAVNKTDWADFEAATGTTIDSITSIEALTDAAEKYYNWTDGLTPDVANDGKALYGRDSLANYIYIGTKELGHEMFKVTEAGVTTDLDKETLKTLWDNYYIPYIKGYFAEIGKYRSDDMKTGEIISLTSSTSSCSYLPSSVIYADDSTHDIEVEIKKPLSFENADSNVAVQQGAGYCLIKSDKKEEYAASMFLKWFTASERNVKFSVESGYSPVKKDANTEAQIKDIVGGDPTDAKQKLILDSLLVSADVFNNMETYTSKPFEGGKDIRYVLQDAFKNPAVADREAVVDNLSKGQSLDEATKQFATQEYFDAWYDDLCKQVGETVK